MLSRVPAIAWWEVFVRKIGFEPGLKKRGFVDSRSDDDDDELARLTLGECEEDLLANTDEMKH